MSNDLTSYIISCLTENVDVITDYIPGIPTVCPHNNTHIIDTANIRIYDRIQTKTVSLFQSSDVTTQGYFRLDYTKLDINPNETKTYDIIYPYNIGIYDIYLLPTDDNILDEIEILYYCDTIIGSNIGNLNINDNNIEVDNIGELKVGYKLYIDNEDLGEVININNNIITFTNPLQQNYPTNSIIKYSRVLTRNIMFINSNNLTIGLSKLTSIGVEANTITRIIYKNNSNNSKSFCFYFELEY